MMSVTPDKPMTAGDFLDVPEKLVVTHALVRGDEHGMLADGNALPGFSVTPLDVLP